MKSFEQASGVMNVSAQQTNPGMGPAGDTCHMQVESGKGGLPKRSKKMNPGGGYSVSSPNPAPSSVMDLSKRP